MIRTADSRPALLELMNYLLVNRPEITQNELIMKRYSLLVGIIITAVTCASSFAQDKASSAT